ncbi:MAG: lysophospholipase [Actinomycetota bacterium]|nr:lysophospholipase [Actinomycetota bacterium]
MHGLSEHSGRYEAVGEQLAGAGLETWSYDLAGHGISGGRRTYVRSFAEYHEELQRRLGEVRARGLPVTLLGHSMGGLIALDYVLADRPPPDLLLLSAPALGAELGWWRLTAARLLGRLWPTLPIANGIRGEQLSRNPLVGEAYFADPLVTTRTTARLGAEALAAIDRVRARLRQLEVPTFVVHGEADQIVPPQATAPLAEVPLVDHILYPGLRHESFNEPEGERVVALMVTWMRERLAARRPP